ncbi:uncharacterized protein LOC142823559, partial [Pelodiscus sinensis]|uniref:uncharacterized protein LOC142823559 n=1 Tax=Pelodiscus sinensis TaxID=13735 RepID=UPI003F6D1616
RQCCAAGRLSPACRSPLGPQSPPHQPGLARGVCSCRAHRAGVRGPAPRFPRRDWSREAVLAWERWPGEVQWRLLSHAGPAAGALAPGRRARAASHAALSKAVAWHRQLVLQLGGSADSPRLREELRERSKEANELGQGKERGWAAGREQARTGGACWPEQRQQLGPCAQHRRPSLPPWGAPALPATGQSRSRLAGQLRELALAPCPALLELTATAASLSPREAPPAAGRGQARLARGPGRAGSCDQGG